MKKSAFISGVLDELGSALARTFRSNGYYVYGTDVREDFHGHCDRFFRFDLDEYVKNAAYRIRFTQIFEELIPQLNVLVNNATLQHPGSLENIKLEHWQSMLNVNLTGPMLLCKLFLARLEASKGNIVNIANASALPNAEAIADLEPSKSSLFGLTTFLAQDLRGKVQVNAISVSIPGVGCERVKSQRLISLKNPDMLRAVVSAEDVSKVVYFLVSSNIGFMQGLSLEMS